jgi:adenylate cyclase
LQESNMKRQKLVRNALMVGLSLLFFIVIIVYRNYRNKIKTNKILDSQNIQIEHLLLNILPAEVAEELQKSGTATPHYYEKVSVLFTDFKSFTKLSESLSPQEIISELNACFMAFDDIIEKYKLEKIKTIGDSYMCAGGIPTPDDSHFVNIVKASLEIQRYIADRNKKRLEINMPPWDVRIGINTGPIVAGVVGKKKYAYDVWGSTVNIASRMESNGEAGRVNISAATYELVKDKYACTYRGKIFAKNIGEIDMYFVEDELNQNLPAATELKEVKK